MQKDIYRTHGSPSGQAGQQDYRQFSLSFPVLTGPSHGQPLQSENCFSFSKSFPILLIFQPEEERPKFFLGVIIS